MNYKRENHKYKTQSDNKPVLNYQVIPVDTSVSNMLSLGVQPTQLLYTGDIEDASYMGMMESITALKNAKINTDQSKADLELLQELERSNTPIPNIDTPIPNIDDPI